MAKANVDTDDVRDFSSSIARESEAASRAALLICQDIENAVDLLDVEIGKAEKAFELCCHGLVRVRYRIDTQKARLEKLLAQLAATPPFICAGNDADGNPIMVPNPEYQRLQNEIAQVQALIRFLESLQAKLYALKAKISEQKEALASTSRELSMLEFDVNSAIRDGERIAGDAIQRLGAIASTLDDYLEETIDPPSLEPMSQSEYVDQQPMATQEDEQPERPRADRWPRLNDDLPENVRLRGTNPHYRPEVDDGWSVNCQRCVPAYEMRKRGYAVTVKPCTAANDYLSRNPYAVWKLPSIQKTLGSGEAAIRSQMQKWGEGARAQVVIIWAADSEDPEGDLKGHTFFAEQRRGQTRFFDPQTGQEHAERYFGRVLDNRTTFCRIDTLDYDENTIDLCCQKEDPFHDHI